MGRRHLAFHRRHERLYTFAQEDTLPAHRLGWVLNNGFAPRSGMHLGRAPRSAVRVRYIIGRDTGHWAADRDGRRPGGPLMNARKRSPDVVIEITDAGGRARFPDLRSSWVPRHCVASV